MKDLLIAIKETTIAIPTYQLLLLLLLQVFCFLLRSARIGLLVSYLFSYYLGSRFMFEHFGWPGLPYLYSYWIFGILAFVLALWSLLREEG